MTADIKTFKLKASGDFGGGKTELLLAFAELARQFGMTVVVSDKDHHLIVTSSKEQREKLWRYNRTLREDFESFSAMRAKAQRGHPHAAI